MCMYARVNMGVIESGKICLHVFLFWGGGSLPFNEQGCCAPTPTADPVVTHMNESILHCFWGGGSLPLSGLQLRIR